MPFPRGEGRWQVSVAGGRHPKIECFYDVGPDGQRFVVVDEVGSGTSDVVLAQGMLTGPHAGAGEQP